MSKGFISFRDGKIPFVIEDYRLVLFTDYELLKEFSKEYNFKTNYTLSGRLFANGIHGQPATFLVERSTGSTCYLRCYSVFILSADGEYDAIGLQSPFLDDVLRYSYEYIEAIRAGATLALQPKDVYTLSFTMDGSQYQSVYRIGHDSRLGLLEDRDRRGEIIVPVRTEEIQECYSLAMVFCRLAMFMLSQANVPFKRVTLYKEGHKVGWFFALANKNWTRRG